MRRKAFVATAGLALAIAVAAITPAVAGSHRFLDVAWGVVITADVALVRNLNCVGDGLTVTNGALLDLHGQRVRGNGTGRGITILGTGTVLTNGTVTGFETGVYSEASNGRIEDLAVKNNARVGIQLDGFHGGGDIVQRNHVEGNGTGIRLGGTRLLVHLLENHVTDNLGDGVVAPDQNDGILVQGNHVTGNGGNGLVVSESVARILDNNLNRNKLDGLRADDRPEFVAAWMVSGNHARSNGGHGLDGLTPGITDGGGNRAGGNGLEPQCVNFTC
jgi:hypothetical protein